MIRRLSCVLIAAFAAGCADTADAPESAALAQSGGFIDASAYADLVVLAPTFPFGVLHRHAASGAVLGARWGRHGGPMLTLGSGRVLRWQTSGATLPTLAPVAAAAPTGLPSAHFWSVDGIVDLPSGAIRAYSSSGDAFAGEVFFYGSDYRTVTARAAVNGYYSGVGSNGGVVYSGLSGLTSTPSTTNESGLWYAKGQAESCATGCTSTRLFGWSGFSGPVVDDADGNVFVAAFVTGGARSDAIFAVPRSKVGAAPVTPAIVAELDAGGTSSFVAAAAKGAGKGWIIGKGHDIDNAAPSWARAYTASADAIVPVGALVEEPIRATSPDASTTFFSDPQGHLWVAVENGDTAAFLELAPRP